MYFCYIRTKLMISDHFEVHNLLIIYHNFEDLIELQPKFVANNWHDYIKDSGCPSSSNSRFTSSLNNGQSEDMPYLLTSHNLQK